MSNTLPRLSRWPALPRRLQTLLCTLGLATAGRQPDCGLGLDGLPQGVGRLPVGSPVALAWQDGAPVALWVQALLRDLLQHGPLMVLAERAQQVAPWLQQADLALAWQQGRLQICLMEPSLAQARRPQGLAPVFGELTRAGLTAGHALLVLAAPQVHLGHSVAQVQQWGQQVGAWCRKRTRPVVFAFDQWDNPLQVLSPLRSLAGVFEHVAVLGSEAQQPMLFVEHWNGSDGPLFEARFGLRHAAGSQRLAYDGSQRRGQLQRLVEAPDQYRVIATQDALGGQRGVPADWQVLDQRDAVLDATGNAQAATVLLHAGSTAEGDELLRLVWELRSRHGRALKIVVRETRDKLRSNLEQALLCLGANCVVYREVGFARLLRQIEELSDSTFAREIQPDFARARAGFMPDALRGYLPAAAFCDSVQAMLERTSPMGLRHSFVRLSMLSHVPHADAVRACVALRDGDVLTADHDALYVFMFACAESDIDPALGRLFSIAPTELFAAQTIYRSIEGVRNALRSLRDAVRQGVPDYSAFRNERSAGAARGAPASAAPPPAATLLEQVQAQAEPEAVLAAPTVQAHPLARRSRPQPLGKSHAH